MYSTKINGWELISLTSIITFTPLLVTLPRSAGETFGTAAVLHAVYIAIVAAIFFFVVFKLYNKLEDKDIFDLAEYVGGKTLKVITGIAVILYLGTASFITVNEFGEDVKNILFVNTEVQNVNLIFLFGTFVAAYFGIKGIFRISSILFPFLILGIIAVYFSLLGDIEPLNLTPILGTGARKVFWEGLTHAGRYNSLFLIFLFAPQIKNLQKNGMLSVLSTSLIIFSVVFLIFSIIPYPEILENYFAFFEITRMISYGRFFQRVEVIFTFLWLFVCLIYLTLALSIMIQTLKKAFNIEFPKLLLPIVCTSYMGLTFIFPSFTSLAITRDFMYNYVTPVVVFLYPFFLLLAAKLKMGGAKKCETTNS